MNDFSSTNNSGTLKEYYDSDTQALKDALRKRRKALVEKELAGNEEQKLEGVEEDEK